MTSHIKTQLLEAFNTTDLYSVFNLTAEATESEVKKGFRQLALIHHPDKGGDEVKFKALCIAYNILSDNEKRAEYDRAGLEDDQSFDENEMSEESFQFYYDFYRNLFPKLTVNDIESFRVKYIGSVEEKQDILEAYDKSMGDIMKIKQFIFFIEDNDEDEARLMSIINKALANDEIELHPKYAKYQTAQSDKENKPSKKKRKQAKAEEGSMEDLAAMMAARREKSEGKKAMDSIISKYGSKSSKKSMGEDSDGFTEIPDDEFEAIQHGIMKRKGETSKGTKSKSQTGKRSK